MSALPEVVFKVPSIEHLNALIMWAHDHRREWSAWVQTAGWGVKMQVESDETRNMIEQEAYIELTEPFVLMKIKTQLTKN